LLAGNVAAGSHPSEYPVDPSDVITPPVIASVGVPCDVLPTAGLVPTVHRDAEKSGAGDPEIEVLQYNLHEGRRNLSSTRTPAVAWVLCTLYLLNMLHTIYTENVAGEICADMAQGKVPSGKQRKPYSRRIMIFAMTLAGYSWNAYSYLRTTVKNCLPCRETLRKYRYV